ncbi:hypothetical protein ASD49_08850 [Ensifer sp. Root1298]|nr:hypothetical protein ASD49_08850 [Ensifer sp. Root1298]
MRFIPWSSQWARAYFKMDYFNGARSLETTYELHLNARDLKGVGGFLGDERGASMDATTAVQKGLLTIA